MTWTAPEIDRSDPPMTSDERTSVESWLDYQRATLLYKCQGLTGEQLVTRAVAPSSLSLLGLVRHMAEVERGWFRQWFAGRSDLPDLYCRPDFPEGDFDLASAETAEADFATFLDECEQSRAVSAGRSLGDTFVGRRGQSIDLRWVYVHMIEEYARHNGHADILREQIDGATGS